MANLFLDSKARGDWWYEIPDGKTKTKHKIKFGFNEIPSEHVKILEKDPGYNARLAKKTYKILKPKEALVAEKSDEKTVDKAQELKQAKEIYKEKIAELKKQHEIEIKKNISDFKTQNQTLIEGRGEALKEVEKIKKENTSLSGKLSELDAKQKKEIENLKDSFAKEKEKLEIQVNDLQESNKKLEGQIKQLKAK